MPRILKDEDEGSDSDGGSFEAVTPEHDSGTPEEQEANPATEKRKHILEDVDGELEMEDVAPSEIEMSVQTSQEQGDQHFPLPFAPPLPYDVPPSSPPLPSSPPPPLPPPLPLPLPPPIPPCAIFDPYANGVDSTIHTSIHVGPTFLYCLL